ncbi:MBL fold metallo-hydrolase [Streptomyces gardneri]|uniref:MBL fold metallo-hydrolase n=1 Tax=Streptomyces gardneri TaxID=66892 RepID=UPI0036B6FF50
MTDPRPTVPGPDPTPDPAPDSGPDLGPDPGARPKVVRRPVGARCDRPDGYRHRLADPLPSPRDMLAAVVAGKLRPDRSQAPLIPVHPEPHGGFGAGPAETSATWVGHATYVVRIGGLTVLTDPVWSSAILGAGSRLTAPGVEWDAVGPVDAVVISHSHYDHLDAATVDRLPRTTPVFVPAGLGRWFRKRGFDGVTELDWWEEAELDGVGFGCVPARHWSRRGPFDLCRTLWSGWVLSGPGHRVYFAGDTAYGPHFARIGEAYPDIDLALMPIGAYEPRALLSHAHVSPEEAVRGCLDAGAARMATMHWGTFALSGEPLLDPLERARAAWRETGRPPADLWPLAVGEGRSLP